jgi:hypothetical protein
MPVLGLSAPLTDSLWLPDHVQYGGNRVAEGWTLLAYALARYPDKLCGHEVLCNSFNQVLRSFAAQPVRRPGDTQGHLPPASHRDLTALFFRKSLNSCWYADCLKQKLVSVERRTSISGYLVLRCRAISRPPRESLKDPILSRWYAPWLAAALSLTGLMLAAIAALEILTATHQLPPLSHSEHVEELVPDVESISAER